MLFSLPETKPVSVVECVDNRVVLINGNEAANLPRPTFDKTEVCDSSEYDHHGSIFQWPQD